MAIPVGSYCFMPNDAFSNRNQAYGAFNLRRIYKKRLSAALIAGSIAFTVGISSPIIYSSVKGAMAVEEDLSKVVELKNLETPPEEQQQEAPPEVEAPPPPPKVSTVRFVPPEVAHDEEVPVEEIPPPQDELKEVQAASITQAGDPNAAAEEVIIEDPVNNVATDLVGTGTGPAKEEKEEEEVFIIVEQQPEFPGGTDAMQRFLQEEVKYPEIARKAGVEGRVFVQFVVGNDGKIRDVQVVRGIGAGCDEEAIRAVKAMPKWIPGKQRGRSVSVRFSMPITFKLK